MKKINKTHSKVKFDDYINEKLEKNPKLAEKLLETALEEYQKDGDEKVLLIVLGQIARAKKNGFTELSRKTGLSREALYKTLSSKGNPRFDTLKLILEALGYKIFFRSFKAS